MTNPTPKPEAKTNDKYDPHIVPAETAAREDREGDKFKKLPNEKEILIRQKVIQ